MKNLDSLDRRILRELQKDGRLSNTELSERISLSQTATTERVKRLTRDGYILGYTARLSPKKLDRAMLVFVEIKLDRTTPDVFATFAAATRRNPDVMECHMVAGGFDYLIDLPPLAVVDMPGYGFAEAPKEQVDAWTRLVFDYLRGRTTLKRVYLLIDARHGVKKNDAEVLDLLDRAAVSYQIVLTKIDKIDRRCGARESAGRSSPGGQGSLHCRRPGPP